MSTKPGSKLGNRNIFISTQETPAAVRSSASEAPGPVAVPDVVLAVVPDPPVEVPASSQGGASVGPAVPPVAEPAPAVPTEATPRAASRAPVQRPAPRPVGRPVTHTERWTKATVVLYDRQLVWLDRTATDIRAKTGTAIARAEILRAMIDAVEGSGIDLSTAVSEESLREMIARKMKR